MLQRTIKLSLFVMFTMLLGHLSAQNTNQVKVDQLIEKKAEYHKLTNGEIDGYRIKIHFGVDKEAAQNVRTKFSAKFSDIGTNLEYQQPNFVVLVGDYKTKLEAFEALKKIQVEFSNAFIVKGKIHAKI
ncbi:MAG: SPOR domain-containing protein [Sphingobacteriaceae bacterium]|nr:SPOR domain-containing protein [Sphingobacteriaceae bacterium]MBK7816539.1 SPOR domain-containing protein [Sphingobacteriaceae bacterium]